MQSSLWCERYRPSELKDFVGNEIMKQKFAGFISNQDIPHLLLTGPTGTGKTTASKILVNSIDCDFLLINASDDNNIETVRTKIRGFASTAGFCPLKIILLDEFDGFSRQGQDALRNLMEAFSDTTRFILTANYIERISEPIISRTQHFEVIPPSRKDVAKHIISILTSENVKFNISDVKVILDAYFPDIRKILNECQSATQNLLLTVNVADVINGDYKLKIIEILKGSSKNKFNEIRQIIADSQIRDFTELFKLLFLKVDEYAPNDISKNILFIAEAQFRASSVVDQEINCMALFANIINS